MKFPFVRRRTVLVRALLGAALMSASLSLQAAEAWPPEIEHLIEFVRDSSCTFIRNGSEHTSLAASEHIAKKAGMARSRIKDGDTLIDTVATKSSITGEPYYVQCPGAPKTESATWLHQELNRFRGAHHATALIKP